MSQPLPLITRRARIADVPALLKLLDQLGYPTTPQAMEERLDRLLARPLVHHVLVAPQPQDDGELLGAMHASRRETLESDDHVEISGLIVDASTRGAGVGKVLVSAAERWARDLGLNVVRVRSSTTRTGAHAFYERLGFRVLKQQIAFIKEL
jgi:GNAT superfamily N-acetyltransferase